MSIKTDTLTPAICRNATIEPGKKVLKLHDGGGLYLWIMADGARYWRMRYWIAGQEKSLALGTYPLVCLPEARDKHKAIKALLESGIDPANDRREKKEKLASEHRNTFKAVALEWHKNQTWSESRGAYIMALMEENLFPKLGHRPIAYVTAKDMLHVLRGIENRGTPVIARRVLWVSSNIFRYAISCALIGEDPTVHLKGALAKYEKSHYPSISPKQLPKLLRDIDSYTGTELTRLALKLLALTFVRTNELVQAQWSEFDIASGLWIIPASRMKMRREHVVPLSRQALMILGQLADLAGATGYVFPGQIALNHMNSSTMLAALYRMGYRGKMTGHGFRSVASTILHETGFNPEIIERQLAHIESSQVRRAYNKAEYLHDRSKMMQHWADYLDGIASGATILHFHRETA